MIIYKFPIDNDTTIQVPHNALFLHAGEQDGSLYIWVQLDPTASKVSRTIQVVPTGLQFDHNRLTYFQTVQMRNGLVFHVYLQQ